MKQSQPGPPFPSSAVSFGEIESTMIVAIIAIKKIALIIITIFFNLPFLKSLGSSISELIFINLYFISFNTIKNLLFVI